ALQNQNNPLSQALTQANQAFVAQSQQLNANVRAAADRIFSTWSHHVDQVVHNIPGLQGPQDTIQPSAELQANTGVRTQEDLDTMARQCFDGFIQTHAQGGSDNGWGIYRADLVSYKTVDRDHFQLEINLGRLPFLFGNAFHSTLTLKVAHGTWWDESVARE